MPDSILGHELINGGHPATPFGARFFCPLAHVVSSVMMLRHQSFL